MTATLEARVLVCGYCGAPLPVPEIGGTIPCGYCKKANVVAARPFVARALGPAGRGDEARQARLRAQVASSDESPYSLNKVPPGFEDIDGYDSSDATRGRLVEAFRAAAALTKVRPDEALDHRLFWVTERIGNLDAMAGQDARSRPHLETACELVRDAGYRQILLCDLAALALDDGRPDAAEGWLALCDPASEVLHLDNAYRSRRASLAIHRGAYDEALLLLGASYGEVAEAEENIATFATKRIHALERTGRAGEAEGQLRQLLEGIASMTAAGNVQLVGSEMTYDELMAKCRHNAAAFVSNMIAGDDFFAPVCAVWQRLAARGQLSPLGDAAASFSEWRGE